MNMQPTVMTEKFEGFDNALRMTWQQSVDPLHVRPACERIVSELNTTDKPVYVVVDLLRNPKFPLAETMLRATEAYRRPMLAEWLIRGGHRGQRRLKDSCPDSRVGKTFAGSRQRLTL